MNNCIAAGLGIHFFVTVSRLFLEPNQPDLQWLLAVQWSGHGANSKWRSLEEKWGFFSYTDADHTYARNQSHTSPAIARAGNIGTSATLVKHTLITETIEYQLKGTISRHP
jgi:hypothetical protein